MIDIIWGRENVPRELVPITVLNSPYFFFKHKDPSWFADPFIQECISAIDHATVITGEVIRDYKGVSVSTEVLSTGTKTLCCMYYDTEHIFYGSLLGNNCLPFLVRIAENRDITVLFEHYADFTAEDVAKGILRHNGVILDQRAYDCGFSAWNASTEEDDYFDRCLDSGL